MIDRKAAALAVGIMAVVVVVVVSSSQTPQVLPDDEVVLDPVVSEQICDRMLALGWTPETLIDVLAETSGDPRPVVAQIVNGSIDQACPWFGHG